MPPDVSVVVPVHDAMPYLTTCLASVREQTLGAERVEVVAVDDGSTDGSGDQLDLLARRWPGLRVVHRPASGGPSRPRNVGLGLATGRFVFFLDADDYLGADALARMVVLADDSGAALVTCRRRGVGGRSEHAAVGAGPRHDGVDGSAYEAASLRARAGDRVALLTAVADCKHLFRRDRVERLGLRFDESLRWGEDTVFSAAYVTGATVRMVDDYDCYYERLREDGGNLTARLAGSPEHLASIELGLRLQEGMPELRWRREQHLRDALVDLTEQILGRGFADRAAGERRELVDAARRMLERWQTPRSVARLPALGRVKIELVRRGLEPELCVLARAAAGERGRDVVSGGRVYAAYPFFRDARVGVPDECFDVTAELTVHHHLDELRWDGPRLRLAGHAYVEHVDTDRVGTELVLRDRLGRDERRCPVRPVPTPGLSGGDGPVRYDYGRAGFEVDVDVSDVAGARLSRGRWAVMIAAGSRGVLREVPLGGNRGDGVGDRASCWGPPPGSATASFGRFGTLTLEVGG